MSRPFFFATDLHGREERYHKLFQAVREDKPEALFLGGDLLPSAWLGGPARDFLQRVMAEGLARLRDHLGAAYPRVFVILGNDDGKGPEPEVEDMAAAGLWHYIHGRHEALGPYTVYGYAYIPPSPFLLKDWEKYDVSAYVPPGCVPLEEGRGSGDATAYSIRQDTIQSDLETWSRRPDLDRSLFLFHGPPHDTNLDRAALDGKSVDHVPLDVHIGSIAVRRFVEAEQPLLTLHGHVHESARLTGSWRDRIGRTHLFGGAHDGPELALVRFHPESLEKAERLLL